ncbi:hypothetical protein [Candidatus Rariloculus sp.]|uniref:hypothetical protein n=1 Tax=Candidatus Rariloculus sp. TaxID=3101265 RepID=UPI003D0BF414
MAERVPDNIPGAAAARWLQLSPEMRERTGVMAPSRALRVDINAHIRGRLSRESTIDGPALRHERLDSYGYTRADKSFAENYSAGDVVAFHRPYKRLGVVKGDERSVVEMDHKRHAVLLEDGDGKCLAWQPSQLAGRNGGSEVYRAEGIELRTGDRILLTRNDQDLGLVNSRTAEVLSVVGGCVAFRLEDGRELELKRNDPQLRHLGHAWALRVHAFQGRTVDNLIAAMEAEHPHLTTQNE